MTQKKVREWVEGVLSLASCGGSHEIERDEELTELQHKFEDTELTKAGLVLVAGDGQRFLVRVEKLS